MAALIALSAVVSFAQSYRGLIDWAALHNLPVPWAQIAPLSVDTFAVVGELTLYVSLIDGWPWRSRAGAWAITCAGLALSLAGNVWHVQHASWQDRATFGVWPIAAGASLAVGLGVLKRVAQDHRASAGAGDDMNESSHHAPGRGTTVAPCPEPAHDEKAGADSHVRTGARDPGWPGSGDDDLPGRQPPAPLVRQVRAKLPQPDLELARAELARAGANGGLPSARALARDYLGGNRRLAGQLLAEAGASPNGNGAAHE